MEESNFNGTMIAQLFNFLVMILLVVFVIKIITKAKRARVLEEDIDDIRKRLQEIENKLDKKQ
ncbi:hypothetical protein [Desulforamulus aquiferis]|uniref:Uncharacterized protein n=1 Tax=Desulforamulus aquiferis TaxID=1397668 RepID=A0AAW7Z9U3_9FIRM|nr:hypothetical protein [Desulforamulus aquiferis]MDO7786422.1 hypothetical protein [Desulforamulus aquiferis]